MTNRDKLIKAHADYVNDRPVFCMVPARFVVELARDFDRLETYDRRPKAYELN